MPLRFLIWSSIRSFEMTLVETQSFSSSWPTGSQFLRPASLLNTSSKDERFFTVNMILSDLGTTWFAMTSLSFCRALNWISVSNANTFPRKVKDLSEMTMLCSAVFWATKDLTWSPLERLRLNISTNGCSASNCYSLMKLKLVSITIKSVMQSGWVWASSF